MSNTSQNNTTAPGAEAGEDIINAKENPEKKIRTYVGRRLEGKKLVHTFMDASGTRWTYPKAKASRFAGALVGRVYDLTEGLPLVWRDVETGQAREETRERWQGQDRAAVEMQKQNRVKPAPELDEAINTLRQARSRLFAGSAAAFDAWLLNQIR